MKKSLLALVLSLSLVTSTFSQVTPEYTQTLTQMLELSGSKQTFAVAIDQMMGIFKQQNSKVPADFWDELTSEFKKTTLEELVEMLAPIYYEHLSLKDVKAIVKFYKSSAGKKLAEKTPMITQQSMQVGQQWGRKIGEKIAERLQKEGYGN